MALNQKRAFVERTEFLTNHREESGLSSQSNVHPFFDGHHFSRAFRITNNWAIIACRRTFRLSRRHLKTALGSSEATALHFLAINKTWHTS